MIKYALNMEIKYCFSLRMVRFSSVSLKSILNEKDQKIQFEINSLAEFVPELTTFISFTFGFCLALTKVTRRN